MEENNIDIANYIQFFLSGEVDNSMNFVNLMIQATAIIIVGIILWRISAIFHKKKLSARSSERKFGNRISNQIRNKGRN